MEEPKKEFHTNQNISRKMHQRSYKIKYLSTNHLSYILDVVYICLNSTAFFSLHQFLVSQSRNFLPQFKIWYSLYLQSSFKLHNPFILLASEWNPILNKVPHTKLLVNRLFTDSIASLKHASIRENRRVYVPLRLAYSILQE